MVITSLLVGAIGIFGLLVLSPWVKIIWWIQMLGYVKAVITVIKYSPQVRFLTLHSSCIKPMHAGIY